jgi:hypothetical protein
MKILLGDFNAKVGRKNIFKPTIVNESLLEISNDNGVRVVNFAKSKDLVVKSTMFTHCNIHKYNWTFSEGNADNQIDHVLLIVIPLFGSSKSEAETGSERVSCTEDRYGDSMSRS